LVIVISIFGGLLTPAFSSNLAQQYAFATPSGGGGDTGGSGNGDTDSSSDDEAGDDGGEDQRDPDPDAEQPSEPNSDTDSDTDRDSVSGPEPPEDPCKENPVAEGCEPEPPIGPCIKDPTAEGCKQNLPYPPPPPCPLNSPLPGCKPLPKPPDDDCLYQPSLPKCAPIDGKCPPGFLMNEDGQCFPDKPCPPGFARVDDKSGACLPVDHPVPPNCDPSYPGNCIPSSPPDLECGDNGVPDDLKVLPPDPHRFDLDKDGIGCEAGSGGEAGGGTGGGDNGNIDRDIDGSSTAKECQGEADCFRGKVTEIVDGDTIDINNVRVRLALVDTPERGQSGYTEAIDFVELVCSIGTTALVDEDDGQKEGSFDRLIGLVYCGENGNNNKKSINELLLERGYAVIYQDFCNISEHSLTSWAQRHGC
jgi:hypothetical protein